MANFKRETETVLTIWKAAISAGPQLLIPSLWMVIYFHHKRIAHEKYLAEV